MSDSRLITVKEASRLLGLSISYVYTRLGDHVLPIVIAISKSGRATYRYRLDDVLAFKRERETRVAKRRANRINHALDTLTGASSDTHSSPHGDLERRGAPSRADVPRAPASEGCSLMRKYSQRAPIKRGAK